MQDESNHKGVHDAHSLYIEKCKALGVSQGADLGFFEEGQKLVEGYQRKPHCNVEIHVFVSTAAVARGPQRGFVHTNP